LICNGITEPMIGIDWMEKNDTFWVFRRGAIRIQGKVYRLSERHQRDVWVQRAILARATMVCRLDPVAEQPEEEESTVNRIMSKPSCTTENQVESRVSSETKQYLLNKPSWSWHRWSRRRTSQRSHLCLKGVAARKHVINGPMKRLVSC